MTVNESDGMYLIGDIQAGRFDLRSLDYLLNAPGLDLQVAGIAAFRSATGVVLGLNAGDQIMVCGEARFAAPQLTVVAPAANFTTPVVIS